MASPPWHWQSAWGGPLVWSCDVSERPSGRQTAPQPVHALHTVGAISIPGSTIICIDTPKIRQAALQGGRLGV